MAIDREATLKNAETFLRAGRLDAAIAEYARLLDDQPTDWDAANALSELYLSAGDFARAAGCLTEFAARLPTHVPSLLKLVEVCVDGNLEQEMFEAQAQLADAYLANGRAADARVIAEDLVARAPDDPSHVDRLGRAVAALKKEHTPAATPDAVEVDLTSLLGDLQGQARPPEPVAPPRDLEDVFAGLRAEAESSEEDEASGDHFELARTYLDMGRPQDAIGSLEMAARSPRYRFAAASMLAEIYRDEGDLRAAIEWCERAAEVPAPEPEQGRSLLYDLADLLETVGETARALAVFMELAADTPDYRDVRARVTRLSRLETEG